MRALVLAALWAGCGAAAPTPQPIEHDLDAPPRAHHRDALVVTAATLPGWIGFAARRPDADHGNWIPAAIAPIVVPIVEDGKLVGSASVLTEDGAIAATFNGHESIAYGCDNNHLDVITIQVGTRPPPAVVWVVAGALPAGWDPHGVAVVADTPGAKQATWRVGELALTLGVTDHDHAALAITRAGRTLATLLYEREVMAGDDSSAQPLAVSAEVPGMPVPVAAWALAPDGPIVIALRLPDHEGNSLRAILVTGDHAELAPLNEALYQCAF